LPESSLPVPLFLPTGLPLAMLMALSIDLLDGGNAIFRANIA